MGSLWFVFLNDLESSDLLVAIKSGFTVPIGQCILLQQELQQ